MQFLFNTIVTLSLSCFLGIGMVKLTEINKEDFHSKSLTVAEVGHCVGENSYDVICTIKARNNISGIEELGTIRSLAMEGQTVYKTCWTKVSDKSLWCDTNFEKVRRHP